MGRIGRVAAALGVCAVSVAAQSASAGAQVSGPSPTLVPVPSLNPKATNALWGRLADGHQRLAGTATSDCRPARVIFYAQTDWLRLATKLAADASGCAQYYISVPPLSSDKTQERSDQAWRIRALGANFHALAEINKSAWASWVAAGAGTWYQAGLAARQSMAAAGFDVSQGDTWALNEFGSGIRQGNGTARQDARDFVHGLYDGGGALPAAKGVVWTVGMGQGTTFMTTYKTNLENWLQDSAFWNDMNAYVSDWSQEVYGDFRNYGVAGSTLSTRRDYENDYLQHVLVLANAGPATTSTAGSYLQRAYEPLANAAWAYTSGYGWTSIPYDQMENYTSAQTYAMRNFSANTGQAQDRFGFAWAPTNSLGLSSTDFTTQTGAILDRLAAGIHDSAQPIDPADPGSGACGPLGQNLWCNGQIDGAWFNDAWKTFRVWALPPTLSSFTPTSGAVGSNVTISGSQLSGATSVTFNGTSATFTVNSDSQITAIVPAGARTGPIAVTTPAGTTTSATSFTVSTAGAQVASDGFNRTVSGGWGAADVGGPWAILDTPASWSVSPGTGSIGVPATAQRRGLLRSVSVRDVDLLAKITLPRCTGTGHYCDAFVIGRASAGSNPTYYRVGVVQGAGSGDILLRAQLDDGTSLASDADTGIPASSGAQIMLRVQFQGVNPTVIRARAWRVGTAEPSAWLLNKTNSNSVEQTAGSIGLRVRNEDTTGSHTFAFQSYQAISLAPPGP
jgi:hypothetical protein